MIVYQLKKILQKIVELENIEKYYMKMQGNAIDKCTFLVDKNQIPNKNA